MGDVVLQLEYLQGTIEKKIFDTTKGCVVTGIEVVDNDAIVRDLNKEIEEMYSSLFKFNVDGKGCVFDETEYSVIKDKLSALIAKVILRLDEINDGSFKVINKLPTDLLN